MGGYVESFVTGALGLACQLSFVVTTRLAMFAGGRYLATIRGDKTRTANDSGPELSWPRPAPVDGGGAPVCWLVPCQFSNMSM